MMAKRAMAMDAMDAQAAGMPQQEAIGEYHLYTIPRRTTIKQNQSKQVALMDASGVKFTRKLSIDGRFNWFIAQMGEERDTHPDVVIQIENKEANALGLPLPAGTMRMYQEDSEGALQFLGEDNIKHTPKDETIRLTAGKAFDVVSDRKQTDFKTISERQHEAEMEIVVRNHKDKAARVELVEPVGGDWEMLKNSQDYEKRSSNVIAFVVDVPANGESKVTYRVRTRY